MDIQFIINAILWLLAFGMIVYLAVVAIIFYFIYKFVKKYPLLTLFTVIVLGGAGILAIATGVGFIPGMALVAGALITFVKQYGIFKSAIRKYIK